MSSSLHPGTSSGVTLIVACPSDGQLVSLVGAGISDIIEISVTSDFFLRLVLK